MIQIVHYSKPISSDEQPILRLRVTGRNRLTRSRSAPVHEQKKQSSTTDCPFALSQPGESGSVDVSLAGDGRDFGDTVRLAGFGGESQSGPAQ